MKNLPLVSGIIATYNRGHIVSEAIESMLGQTYKNLELIVVDDGSTDDTQDKLKQYAGRIRIVHQRNSGPAAAWNRGVEASHGEIIAFLGSDDIWLPTFVQRQVSVLSQVGELVPCVLANAWMKYADGRMRRAFDVALLYPSCKEGIWLNVPDVITTRFVMFGQTVAVWRRALERVGGFDEKLWYLEDYDMALRLSLIGNWGFIQEPLVVWRQGTADSGSLSQAAGRDPVQVNLNFIRIYARIWQALDGKDQQLKLQKRIHRKIRKARLNLILARLCQMNSRGARSLGTILNKLDQHWCSAIRRSPWFPEMKACPLDYESPESGELEILR